jgi:hypothetical protein
MEDKNAVVVRKTEEMQTSESEVVNVVVFDKDAMYQDLTDGLKDFGVGCCEAGKVTLAPLASTMVRHFFNWIICSILK